jgi:hypothetical protein
MQKTKTVLLGTTKILQWNAGGLSSQNFFFNYKNAYFNQPVKTTLGN